MSELPPIQTTEPNSATSRESQGLRIRTFRAIVGAVIVFGYLHHMETQDASVQALSDALGQQQISSANDQQEIKRLQGLAAGLANVSPGTISGDSLKKVSTLSGYGESMSSDAPATLRASLVQLVRRVPKVDGSTPNAWEQDCTGLKISVDRDTYVISAGHCLAGERPLPPATADPADTRLYPSAYDVSASQTYEFGAESVLSNGSVGPVTSIDGISRSSFTDATLLKVDAVSAQETSFSSQPSYPDYQTTLANSSYIENPGQPVALYTLPVAAKGAVVSGVGTYVGQYLSSDTKLGVVNLVGLTDVRSGEVNPCNYGASGSSAVTSSGEMMGLLSYLNATKYRETPQAGEIDPSLAIPNGAYQHRLAIEGQTNLDLDKFDVICEYSPLEGRTIDDLKGAFGHVLPAKYVPQSGGK